MNERDTYNLVLIIESFETSVARTLLSLRDLGKECSTMSYGKQLKLCTMTADFLENINDIQEFIEVNIIAVKK